jgi:glutaredoxin 3
MPKVVMYTSQVCPFCIRAKQLLQSKDVEVEEIRIDRDRKQRRIMIERTRRHTVPQIYIDDFHVGGFQDLAALDAQGELDRLLGR